MLFVIVSISGTILLQYIAWLYGNQYAPYVNRKPAPLTPSMRDRRELLRPMGAGK